jgi:hypothetical protein
VSDYSHGTGFINWWGWDPVAPDRTYLTDVTAAVRRGATVLSVSALGGGLPVAVCASCCCAPAHTVTTVANTTDQYCLVWGRPT